MKIPLYVFLLIGIGIITMFGTVYATQTFSENVVVESPNRLGVGSNNPGAALHVVAPNQASGTDAVRLTKQRDAVNSVRYTFGDVGGTSSDGGGGAFWRGVQFSSPQYTESAQGKFGVMTMYSEYDTLTDPNQKLWVLSANQNHDIAFRSLSTDLMKLKSSGEVGFGTSNPSERLDVNGNIKLTGNILSNGDICIGTCS